MRTVSHAREVAEAAEQTGFFRRYFEAGCKCIAGGSLALLGSDVSDAEALESYQEGCTCSRNFNRHSPPPMVTPAAKPKARARPRSKAKRKT